MEEDKFLGIYIDDLINVPIIKGPEYDDTLIKQNIEEIKSKNTTQDSKIKEIQLDVEEIKKKNTKQDTDIQALQAKDSLIDADIEELKSKDKTLENDISEIKTEQETQNTDISNLQEADETIKSDIESIKEENTKQDTTIEGIQSTIEEIQATNTTRDTTIEQLQTKDQEQDTKIGECVKTETYTEEQAEQDTKIEVLEQENTMLKNLLPTVSSSGEDITLTGTAEAKFKKFRVEGNSVQEGEPSIETPIEIRNCGDNVNLIPTTADGWINGLINPADGTITANNKTRIHNAEFIKVKEETDYYLKINNSDVYMLRQVFFYNEDGDFIETIEDTLDLRVNEVQFKTPSNCKKLYVVIQDGKDANNEITADIIPDIQIKLELGLKATPYSPYNCGNLNIKVTDDAEQEQQSQTVSFPLKKGQVLHKDDYLASNGVHQARKATIMDENSDIGLVSHYDNGIYNYYCHFVGMYEDIGGTLNVKEIKSNYFKQSPFKESYDLGDMIKNNSGSNSIYFMINFETVEDFKAWLKEKKESGNPIIIEYPLAEEIVEEYTEEQKTAYDQLMSLTSYKDTTHIFSEDEVSPVFDVTAYAKATDTVQEQTILEPQEEPTFKAEFLRESEVE